MNPWEFIAAGNPLVWFSNDRITLKANGGKTIQQYGVRALNWQWDNKLIKPIFHTVEAKGPILLGLTTLRTRGLFQKHPKIFIEWIDIHQIQQDNLVSCVAGVDMSHNDINANEQNSVSDGEWLDPEVAEIMDVTDRWVDAENIDSKHLNVQGPKYIHPDSDISTRPTICSKDELKEMYPECFSGVGTFKNYRYHTELDLKVKPVIHPQRKIALSLQPKWERELDEMVKQGIIVLVDEQTYLVNSLVVRENTHDSMRTCLHPKHIKKAIQREHNSVPTVDMVTNRLQGATLFPI